MNILLVYPEFPDTFWSFKHALKFVHKKASMPPLGLLTVAAMLPEGWHKRLVDVNVIRLTDMEKLFQIRILDEAEDITVDYIFLTHGHFDHAGAVVDVSSEIAA